MTTPFDNWLAAQAIYQAKTHGVDYPAMREDVERKTVYVTAMLNAAFLELAEAQQETPWKPWMTGDRAAAWEANRGKFVGELVDVLFFVANALCAVDCTDGELAEAYAAKMHVNVVRQLRGYSYDYVTKCPQCQRALDEPGALPIVGDDGRTYCSTLCAALATSRDTAVANPERIVR